MDQNHVEKDFRTEINGLRAVAVILVLLFHLEYSLVQGGFLGVDVFLVISGYLISKHILRDLSSGKFSFIGFYGKRFKRLYPALLFTLVISLAVGYVTLPPADLERLGKATLSGLFWMSNIFFLGETGYFDNESVFKPILHVWSLSLEEQFYFIWPFLLWLTFKIFKKALFLFVIGLIVLSIYLCYQHIDASPAEVFFLLQYRFFEFLLGAVVIWFERFKVSSKIIPEVLVVLGLGLIVYSGIEFASTTPMPGILSLIPCGGAMLVIYGGNAKYSGWLLRNKVIDVIGRASYSIYLIHWPLIVYYKYYTLSELTTVTRVELALASIVFGFLMWKFVEPAFKTTTRKIDVVWAWIPTSSLLITILAFSVWTHQGYPSRYGEAFTMSEEEILANRERYWNGTYEERLLNGTSNETVVFVGNSFSMDLMYAMRGNGFEAKILSLQTSHRCFNFTANYGDPDSRQLCEELRHGILTSDVWAKAEAVYMFDHWPLVDLESLKGILTEIRALTKVPIYVFGPKMTFTRAVPYIVHQCRSASVYAINKFGQSYALKDDRIAVNNAIKDFFEKEKFKDQAIYFIDILEFLPDANDNYEIVSSKTSEFLYFDGSHFTEQGAKEFGEKLKEHHPEVFEIVPINE